MNKIHKIKLEIESDNEYRNIEIDLDVLFNKIKRIDKAIEYIENELSEECGNVCGSDLPYYVIDELLDILKGSDKE